MNIKNYVIIGLIGINTIFGLLTIKNHQELSKLKTKYSILNQKHDKEIEETKEAVKMVSTYFEKKGNVTIEALIQSYLEFKEVVKVYDRNVEIYNYQIKQLRESILIILEYLER